MEDDDDGTGVWRCNRCGNLDNGVLFDFCDGCPQCGEYFDVEEIERDTQG